MLVPDDLAAWFLARMDVTAVTSAVTGGWWNGRPDESAVPPYGVFTVERGAVEYTSAGELPRFRINAVAVVDQAATTQAQAVQIAVGNAVPVSPTGATAMIRGGAGTVVFSEPRECAAGVEFPLRGKNDVVGARLSFEVFCQGYTS